MYATIASHFRTNVRKAVSFMLERRFSVPQTHPICTTVSGMPGLLGFI